MSWNAAPKQKRDREMDLWWCGTQQKKIFEEWKRQYGSPGECTGSTNEVFLDSRKKKKMEEREESCERRGCGEEE